MRNVARVDRLREPSVEICDIVQIRERWRFNIFLVQFSMIHVHRQFLSRRDVSHRAVRPSTREEGDGWPANGASPAQGGRGHDGGGGGKTRSEMGLSFEDGDGFDERRQQVSNL